MTENAIKKLLIECLTASHQNPAQAFRMAERRAPEARAALRRIAKALKIEY